MCNKENEDRCNICEYCGSSLVDPNAPIQEGIKPSANDSVPSLICGIVSLFVCHIILGIVAVCIARRNKKENNGEMGTLAKIGRVLGYVGIVIGLATVTSLIAELVFSIGTIAEFFRSSTNLVENINNLFQGF